MRLTTRGRYAVTAVLDLALHEADSPVSLGDISKRQGIASSYLGQLFVRLRQHNLVCSQRGPGGGYYLAKASDQIALSEIIEAAGERIDTTRCGGKANCHNEKQCLTHGLWDWLGCEIYRLLSEVSLAKVIEDQALLRVAARQDREYRSEEIGFLEQKPTGHYIAGGTL